MNDDKSAFLNGCFTLRDQTWRKEVGRNVYSGKLKGNMKNLLFNLALACFISACFSSERQGYPGIRFRMASKGLQYGKNWENKFLHAITGKSSTKWNDSSQFKGFLLSLHQKLVSRLRLRSGTGEWLSFIYIYKKNIICYIWWVRQIFEFHYDRWNMLPLLILLHLCYVEHPRGSHTHWNNSPYSETGLTKKAEKSLIQEHYH